MSSAVRSYAPSVAIGSGAMSADITYLLLILYGLFHFIQNSTVTTLMSLFGSLFMFYLSYLIYKNRNNPIKIKSQTKFSIFKNWLKGYSLTLLNPYTVIFWLSVSSYIATKELQPIYTIFGLFSAIVIWITIMPLIIYKTRHIFSQNIITAFSTISAFILSFFAFGMLWSVIKRVIF